MVEMTGGREGKELRTITRNTDIEHMAHVGMREVIQANQSKTAEMYLRMPSVEFHAYC